MLKHNPQLPTAIRNEPAASVRSNTLTVSFDHSGHTRNSPRLNQPEIPLQSEQRRGLDAKKRQLRNVQRRSTRQTERNRVRRSSANLALQEPVRIQLNLANEHRVIRGTHIAIRADTNLELLVRLRKRPKDRMS